MTIVTWDGIDPETGQPFTWDSPNLRWGSPSYAISRGEYGWQPPAGTLSPTQNKKHTMKHQTYYPTSASKQVLWLSNHYHKLPAWASTLGLSAATLAEIIADVRWLIYIIQDWLPAVRAHNLACTAAAKSAQTGSGGLIALPVFTPPPLPGPEGTLPAVVAKAEGGLLRLFDVIAEWKENNACTDAMCLDLGIIGTAKAGPDYATLRVVLDGRRNGNKVDIDWDWQGYSEFLDACEIEVNRGTGYVPLLTDTTPGCTDTYPQPATQTVWKYTAWYRVGDERVGLASIELSVLVGGA